MELLARCSPCSSGSHVLSSAREAYHMNRFCVRCHRGLLAGEAMSLEVHRLPPECRALTLATCGGVSEAQKASFCGSEEIVTW